ncbi:hypothetical protein [Nonomuraea sp. bgisy101]|uniref:hypothetical protein n=1 Tax=Nonomuraea sp. bgisy101 TaxID=3413784 RepID=UPI003D702701
MSLTVERLPRCSEGGHPRLSGAAGARLDQPSSGFVSLRVKAADEAGNTLSQEMIRAYALR